MNLSASIKLVISAALALVSRVLESRGGGGPRPGLSLPRLRLRHLLVVLPDLAQLGQHVHRVPLPKALALVVARAVRAMCDLEGALGVLPAVSSALVIFAGKAAKAT